MVAFTRVIQRSILELRTERIEGMRRANTVLCLACAFLFSPNAGRSQAPVKVEFEVASLRQSGPSSGSRYEAPPSRKGGPGTSDPERLTYSRFLLRGLLIDAFAIESDQISGPSWIDSETFDIAAKVPPQTTKEQASMMLRNLLVERLKMTFHHEAKYADSYELRIASRGLRFKEATPVAGTVPLNQPGERPLRLELDSNGFPIVPPGRSGMAAITSSDGLNHVTCRSCSISDLTQRMGLLLATITANTFMTLGRVVDKTGLTGKYDFKLEYGGGPQIGSAVSAPALDSQANQGPSLFSALEQQLGLKLEKTKAPLDVLVIDHIEKVPTDN
jgi:uncharacterized protein (TIGR03435 family)